MSSQRMSKIWVGIFFGILAGCMSAQNHPALEEIEKQKGAAAASIPSPFVEGFVAYGSPELRWVGPQEFMVHLEAKDSQAVHLAFNHPAFEMGERAPASQTEGAVATPDGGKNTKNTKFTLSAEVAREQLQALALAVEKEESEFQGCLYPIRVRLIRADNSVVEKQGCRGQKGWPKVVSKMVSDWLNFRFYGAKAN